MKKILFKSIFIFLLLILIPSLGLPANLWRKGTGENTPLGTEDPSDLDDILFQRVVDPLDRLLTHYRENMNLEYLSSSSVNVTSGEIVCSNSSGSILRFRQTTSDTTVDWTDLDTGSETASTTYYVYAVADADATSVTFKISESSSAPTGVTYYRKLGSFYNNASSDIENVISYKLTIGTSLLDYDYDSDWFSTTDATDYIKAHSIDGIIMPETSLDIMLLWRESSSATYIFQLSGTWHDGGTSSSGTGTYVRYDETNVEIRSGGNGWATHYFADVYTFLSNGEVRILAKKGV